MKKLVVDQPYCAVCFVERVGSSSNTIQTCSRYQSYDDADKGKDCYGCTNVWCVLGWFGHENLLKDKVNNTVYLLYLICNLCASWKNGMDEYLSSIKSRMAHSIYYINRFRFDSYRRINICGDRYPSAGILLLGIDP